MALRPPDGQGGEGQGTPVEFTSMLWVVQRFPLTIWAFIKRSSTASRLLVPPLAGMAIGFAVAGTVTVIVPEIVGVPPGVEIRRIRSVPYCATSAPIKYPSVAFGSTLFTPIGENMLPKLLPIRRKAVTVRVPANRFALLM